MEKMVEVERATQEELRQDLKSLFQGAMRVTLEMVLEEELKAMVGARRCERVGSRKDHRNGTYLRRLLTSLGQIDVMVPRSREGGSPADVMGRYRRRSEEVDEMMVEAYVSGVSQRKMGDVTEALLGERVGRSTVRLVAKRLDGAVEALRSAPIEGPHPYLLGRHRSVRTVVKKLRAKLGDDAANPATSLPSTGSATAWRAQADYSNY